MKISPFFHGQDSKLTIFPWLGLKTHHFFMLKTEHLIFRGYKEPGFLSFRASPQPHWC